MRIGYVGMGKLGLPVALAAEALGHEVLGHDPSPRVEEILTTRRLPYLEEGAQELLENTRITLVDHATLVAWSDLVFVAVQTPHEPKYGGDVPTPAATRDFDYAHLTDALRDLATEAERRDRTLPTAVISTVLPGTYDMRLSRVTNSHLEYAYNPYFIAMGTTIRDFYEPEFVLIGRDAPTPTLDEFYLDQGLADELRWTSVVTAELTKMAYNTFIGAKIVFANAVMEIAEKIGADADDVADVLTSADRRLISGAYMRGGMGDGGPCHPRDNVALSHLATELDLSYDLFADLIDGRERQTRWLAEITTEAAAGGPIVVLGEAYKPETNLTDGSPARLLAHVLRETRDDLTVWDPHTSTESAPTHAAAYVVATAHERFRDFDFPRGSTVIDPWRMIPDRPGVDVRRIGAANE